MKALLCLFVLLLTSSCGTYTFESINGITRVEIRTNLSLCIRAITDPTELAPIIAFINRERTGAAWRRSAFGPPIGKINLEPFSEDVRQPSLGIGSNFLEVYSGQYVRTLEEDERRALLQMLQIDEATLDETALSEQCPA